MSLLLELIMNTNMCEAAVRVCLDRAVIFVERVLLTSDTFLGTFTVAKSNDASHILLSKLETSTDIFRASSFNRLDHQHSTLIGIASYY